MIIRIVSLAAMLTVTALLVPLAGASAQGINTISASAPISAFKDVAGKWSGFVTRKQRTYAIDIELQASGQFTLKSQLGNDRGWAQLQNGALVINFTGGAGSMRLALNGASLSGNGTFGGADGTAVLSR